MTAMSAIAGQLLRAQSRICASAIDCFNLISDSGENQPSMKIRMDSDELKAWHEAGHATVCLHLGGDVDAIEFLEGDARGFAVARGCDVMPDLERDVACGGFAAEYHLLKCGYVEGIDVDDPQAVEEVSELVVGNAWSDRQAFARRMVTQENDFTMEEKNEFMLYAIKHAVPIINLHFERMKSLVQELLAVRRIEGARIKELLQIGVPR